MNLREQEPPENGSYVGELCGRALHSVPRASQTLTPVGAAAANPTQAAQQS